jgi:uncharacterized protein (DUF885 family)
MSKIILCALSIVFILSGCKNNAATGSSSGPVSADSAFAQLSREFLDGELAWGPENAVSLGFHQYDGKLTNYSKASLDSELTKLKSYDRQLSALDTSALSAKMFYDYRILQSGIRNSIFAFDDQESFSSNPMTYARAIDVSIYVKRNFSPLEDRVRSIINIENGVPAVYAAARQNLKDSLAKPLINMAILVGTGAASFLEKDLLIALKDVKNDSLMNAFKASNKLAAGEIRAFVDYLKKEKLPKANNNYALGRDKYSKMLLYQEDISMAPEDLLQLGMKQLAIEQDSFNAAAKIINPKKKPLDVYHDLELEHPTADSLIPDARKTLESIRQYIVDKNIVTIPSEIRVILKETLPFARETSTASMDIPGPFEQKATEAYYYITPVDSSWTPKQKEDWLEQFNYYTTDIVTIHEAYPGHYVQFLHLNASDATMIEKIYGSYAYIEGWAHYCEKMLVDEGYGNKGDRIKAAKFRLAQSGDALLRLCRFCVSIKTHCSGMTVDEATKFFMDNWHQGEKPCRQEALRGTFDPGYLFYTVGKLEILKLREDYKKQEGANFSLQKFHDAFLNNGMPPIRLVRERLLTDKTEWGKTL